MKEEFISTQSAVGSQQSTVDSGQLIDSIE